MEIVGKIIDKVLAIWMMFLKKRKKRAGDAFVDFAEINAIIEKLVWENTHLNIERCLVLRAHNGQVGKKLMPIGYKYTSVIAMEFKEPFTDTRLRYQNVPQDKEYVAMIAKLYQNNEVALQTDRMDAGVLKMFYTQERITCSREYFLAHNEEELWFLSIATSQSNETLDSEEHRSTLYIDINRIREIVRPYFK